MLTADYLNALKLDARIDTPMFRQLYEAIKIAVLKGEIAVGTQLPPTRNLAQMLGVSRQTVLNAYELLSAEGYLQGNVGKGSFISHSLPFLTPETAAPEQQAMRPLSSRGLQFADIRTSITTYPGRPRAFRIAMPGLDVFPFAIWARLEARRWRRPDFQLGYSDPAGYLPLRQLLASYLGASRGVHCAAEQILITSGSQQALFLIASLLLAPGDAAWVEDPGYRGTNGVLHATQAQVCPVPVDEQGLCVAHGAQYFPDAKLIYVTPSHQYPLGVTMSLARRLELLAWATQNKTWIVEDDYDSEYRYGGPPLATLQSMDRAGSVIYVGTLSKILFPGLRLGYLVLPPALVNAFINGKAVLDRQTSMSPQIALAEFIGDGHFQRHIKRTREVYTERHAALLEVLQHQLAEHLLPGPSNAGMHIATRLTRVSDDRKFAELALQHGIEVRALSQYYENQENAVAGLLLGFASVPPAETRAAAKVLRDMLQDSR